MSDTVFTIEDAARRALKDGSAASPGKWMTSAEYSGWALRFALGEARTYNLTKLAAGYYLWRDGPLSLFAGSFSAEAGCTYSVYYCGDRAQGPAVMVTAGTATVSTFALTGIPVDFPRMMAALIREIATTQLDEYAQSVSGGSVSPQSIYDQMMKGARHFEGAASL